MIVKGLKWYSQFGGWGETSTQVEFEDEKKNPLYIILGSMDDEWLVIFSKEDIVEELYEKMEEDEGCIVNHFDGSLQELLPRIIKSKYAADICFAMQMQMQTPPFEEQDKWEEIAANCIKEFVGKESMQIIDKMPSFGTGE